MKLQCIVFLTLALSPFFLNAQYNPQALERAEETIDTFKEKDSKFEDYFSNAYGYVVFPSVGKGGIVIGGAYGVGTVYELGTPIGKTKMTQVSLGFQFGGQDYSQVVFFETEEDFSRFKKNKIRLTARASAVAAKKGASADLAYHEGVAIFTKTKAGLMYEATVAGQKMKFKPYKNKSEDKKNVK